MANNKQETRPDEIVKADLSKPNIKGDGISKDYPEPSTPQQAQPQVRPGDIIRQQRTNEKSEYVVMMEDLTPTICKYYTDALLLSRVIKLELSVEQFITSLRK